MFRSLADFERNELLGEGKYGKVYRVIERTTGTIYALKVLVKDEAEHPWCEEVRLHWKVRDCPYVLRMEDWFEDVEHVYLILEYAEQGMLFGYLPLREGAIEVARQIALALKACHARGVIHRDVKPENIMWMANGEVRVSDFGWATDEIPATLACGTCDYLCPQIAQGVEEGTSIPYTAAADLWCFGVLLYELYVGWPPFEAESESGTRRRILQGEVKFPPRRFIPEDMQQLIIQLLSREESERPDWDQVLTHPCFSSRV